jgi:hypothetical protein
MRSSACVFSCGNKIVVAYITRLLNNEMFSERVSTHEGQGRAVYLEYNPNIKRLQVMCELFADIFAQKT